MRTLVIAALFLLQGPGGVRITSGVISGEIRAADGPAVGIRVSALVATDSANATAGATMLAGLAETDNAGRFRLEDLPPGRYYVQAGALDFPSYYPGVKTLTEARVVTLTQGATVPGINFTLARPSGIRVSGRVKDFPPGAPSGLIRVVLTGTASPGLGIGTQDTPVRSDGTFEFLKILPGRYNARMNPAFAPITAVQIQVDDKDLNIEFPMGGQALIGRVSVDDGSKLPALMSAVAAGTPDPLAPVRLVMRRTAGAAPATPAGRGAAAAQVNTTVRADGYFLFPAAAGEYQILTAQLPFGFYMKAATVEPATNQIQVTLTRTPPTSQPRGVKVSGRINGVAPQVGQASRWVTLQMATPASANSGNGVAIAEQRLGESPIRDDGTFEILNVPPGLGTLQVVSPSATAPNPMQMRIEITDRDVYIEFSISTSATPNPPPASTPGALAPALPPTILVPDIGGAPPLPTAPPNFTPPNINPFTP